MEKVEEYGVKIPLTSLSDETLVGIIEDFVLREGTDYGDQEFTLADKIMQVRELLVSGKAHVVFDPTTETCSIITS